MRHGRAVVTFKIPDMYYPTISDFVRALENSDGIFRTLDGVAAERDIYGDIELRCGNSAAVFTYRAGGKRRFLKCYVRPNRYLRQIYAYVEREHPQLLGDFRLLQEELYVDSISGGECWVDVVEGEWAEGETLDRVIPRAARSNDHDALSSLAGSFDSLCRQLLAQEWAHGDLKPENIVFGSDGRLTLIDCDAMWIPELEGLRAVELGTPAYAHPLRTTSGFGKRIDDYPMLLISASLHALAADPSLYAKYNTSDNIIFSPAELVGGVSAALDETAGMFEKLGMARELRMLEACCSPFADIDDTELYFAGPQEPIEDPETFENRGLWGFQGRGRGVIAPFWDDALDFRGGVAAVRLGEWWHLCDRSGNLLERGLRPAELKHALSRYREAVTCY